MRKFAFIGVLLLLSAGVYSAQQAVSPEQLKTPPPKEPAWAFPVQQGTLPAEPGPKKLAGSDKSYTPEEIDNLMAPPDWFPHNHRVQLIRPLRDLQPKAPPASRLDAAIRLAEDDAIEPENLRRAVAALLWQWGTKRHAQAIVDKLVVASGEGDPEDRVQSTLELADYLCLLREYKQSANAHRAAQALAKGALVRLKPLAWYAAACVHALLGDVDRGLVALDTCADLLASPDLDSSLRLPRAMFDTDPELALLRRDARFATILQKAFAVSAERSGR